MVFNNFLKMSQGLLASIVGIINSWRHIVKFLQMNFQLDETIGVVSFNEQAI